jgi:hypothetical protein
VKISNRAPIENRGSASAAAESPAAADLAV